MKIIFLKFYKKLEKINKNAKEMHQVANIFNTNTLLTQDVIWSLIQRFLNVMAVRWTTKQGCVPTGYCNNGMRNSSELYVY